MEEQTTAPENKKTATKQPYGLLTIIVSYFWLKHCRKHAIVLIKHHTPKPSAWPDKSNTHKY